jgi:hypothetical protein
LLIATGLAIFLILQPPGDDTNAAIGPTLVTQQPTATAPAAVTTPPPNGTQQPQSTQAPQGTRPAGTTTPGANPTATRPAGATTPTAGSGTVTVASGDTLSSICDRVKPASMSNPDCVDFIVTQNNLASANDISIGETLRVPQ